MKTRRNLLLYALSVATSLLLIAVGGVVNRLYLPVIVAQGVETTATPTPTATLTPSPTPTSTPSSGFTYSDQPVIVYARNIYDWPDLSGSIVALYGGEPADYANAPFIMSTQYPEPRGGTLPGVVLGPAIPVGPPGNQHLEPREGPVRGGELMAVVVRGFVKVHVGQFCDYYSGSAWDRDRSCWGPLRSARIDAGNYDIYVYDAAPVLGFRVQEGNADPAWYYVNSAPGKW